MLPLAVTTLAPVTVTGVSAMKVGAVAEASLLILSACSTRTERPSH